MQYCGPTSTHTAASVIAGKKRQRARRQKVPNKRPSREWGLWWRWARSRHRQGANTGTVQVGRKSIAELIIGRIGTRPLCFKERAKLVSPSFLVIRILLKSELQHSLDSPLRFGPRQRGLKGGDGVEEPVRGRQRNLVDETLRGGDGASIEGGNSASEHIDEAVQLGGWERPVDISVPFRGVAVEVVRAENDFERAAAADQVWEAFGATAAGMHSHPDLGLAESRVFARRDTHVTGEDALAPL